VKRAVSISLGSATRDKEAVVNLLGEDVSVQRIGTDGDIERAIQLYNDLDGKVDAFGVGGVKLGFQVGDRYYPLRSASKLVAGVRRTPVVEGAGLKQTLERRIAQFVEQEIGAEIQPKRVLITSGVDRYGSVVSFVEAGYDILIGDLAFALGLPIPIRSLRGLRLLARVLLPLLSYLPISVLYPTGEKQEEIVPKFESWYAWASVIAGDCLYVKHHMPDRLDGKVVVTNTTTEADVEAFRQRGVRYLVTSTPRLDGRSFGTNMMEAALVAAVGSGQPLGQQELERLLEQLGLTPTIQRLNE